MPQAHEFEDVAAKLSDEELMQACIGRIIDEMEQGNRRQAEIAGHILCAWYRGDVSKESVVAWAGDGIVTDELDRWLE